MSAEDFRQQQLIQLKEILTNWFSRDELEDLSFDLGVDYSALGGLSKEGNVRHLIMELSRRGRLPKLIERCDLKKPEIEWGIFSYLYQEDYNQAPLAAEPPRQNNNRLLLTLVGILALVILTAAGAATYFLTRTVNPTPTAQPAIIQLPIQNTPAAQPISVQPTPTNIVITAIPSVDSETADETIEPTALPTQTQISIVETATLPSDVASQTQAPFTVKITDTYQDAPLQEANIRSGPGLEYGVVARLNANTEIIVWAYAYNSTGIPWYLIEIGDGNFGWISGVLVEIDPIPFENFPVAATVPPTRTPIPTATPTETPIPTSTPLPTLPPSATGQP